MQPRAVGILALALAAGAGVGLAAPTVHSVAVESDSTSTRAELKFDDVPGFGRTTDAMNRDDQIAAYQAYLREKSTQECMTRAGWRYRIDLRYPVDSLRNLQLAVPTSSGPVPTESATSENNRYVESLKPGLKDGYYRALLSESANDVAYVASHDGLLPPDRKSETFGKGGCVGAALAVVGRIWDLRESLIPELVEARSEARLSPDMAAASEKLSECAASLGQPAVHGPWSIDQLAASGEADVELLVKVEGSCLPDWTNADNRSRDGVDQQFVLQHESELLGQVNRYARLMEESASDSGFAETVRDEIRLGGA